ncbi:MAG: AAA family ATPase, partial [Propionibacteriaceae bacterium]|nr:AAA family ATPase [Propionibacteriaceae bacterium]
RSRQSAAVQQASLAEQAGRAAQAEIERAARQLEQVAAVRGRDGESLAQLTARLERAQADPDLVPPPKDRRQELADQAKAARAAEMEARLALRTVEERARSLAGRSESLRRAAEQERQARARAAAVQAQLAAEAARAEVVARAATWLAGRVEASLALAAAGRAEAGRRRETADAAVAEARRSSRQLADHLETIVDTAHRDELARAQQRMRIDALAERALAEVGLDAEALMAEYGPDRPIPSSQAEPEAEDGPPPTRPFVREEQLKRLRTAERDLQLLGRINPLALEEYDAMQERHRFLAEQLDDLRRTRSDLLAIVDDVDARVQTVFAQAYADVEREFGSVFARLFPGGQGRLFLTEPGQWLTTGVDVEARPAGKNVKRLSLLSGGERSLVAICFLVALFKARPSPFYILDEVEAALDDTNLGRLLEIYEELRRDSQLVVITHQKRTMEIADVLYGVSMRDDGISNVVSQRLRTE